MDDEESAMDREQFLIGATEAVEATLAVCEPEPDALPAAECCAAPVAGAAEGAEQPARSPEASEATPGLTVIAAETPADNPTAAQVVEALLFASDGPLSAARLAELSGIGSPREVERHIASLNEKYTAAGLSFRIEPIARGYQMLTLPAYKEWLVRLDKHRGQTRLSAAALEALSIVAYKQPVIRADIEAIRGVACGEVLNRLREMGLIKIVGRAEIVGRPILYGTTRKFLDAFGLADLNDLPPMESLSFHRPPRPTAVTESEPAAPGDGSASAMEGMSSLTASPLTLADYSEPADPAATAPVAAAGA